MMRTFDDNQVESLLRAAHEVDEVERSLAAVTPRATLSLRNRWRVAGGVALLAASVALVVAGMLNWSGGTTAPPSGSQSASVTPRGAKPATQPVSPLVTSQVDASASDSEANGKVLLAIVGHPDGSLRCVNWSAGVFQGRALSEIRDDELKSVAMSMQCFNPAERLLVVGVEGPRSRLPLSDEGAQELARCMLATPGCGGDVGSAFNSGACVSSACLTTDVSVRVKSVAMTP